MNITSGAFLKRHFLIRIMVAILTLAVCACLYSCGRTENKGVEPPEKITIAYSYAVNAALARVALVQGYYQQEGLDITAHEHSHGKPALQEVLDGKADIATVAETPFMFAVLGGEKISIIATIQTGGRDNAILARKDRGIRVPGDLRGRKIAVALGTTSDFFMDSFLSLNGIQRNTVTVVSMKPEEMQEALASGSVDAVSAFVPWLLYAEKKLGGRGVAFFDKNIYTLTFHIVAKQEFIRNNPSIIKKILRSLIRAEEFMARNPSEAQTLIADYAHMDVAFVREICTDMKFSVSLDQSLILALEDESEWAIKKGLTKATKVPNYLDYIYLDGLKSVKSEAVRILR
jgi:NitT/TauT family transport system substrate-binding protein